MDGRWQAVELGEVVALMRARGVELEDVEVKLALGGLPQSLVETMSAFANTRGGLAILGLDEKDGFAAVGISNPSALRDAVVQLCREKLTPPLQPSVEVAEVDNRSVLTVEIEELPTAQKPCHVTSKGRYGGSYVRCGDGDHRLTAYEVDRLCENSAQPRWDREPVPEAGFADLAPDAVRQIITTAATDSPRSFTGLDDQESLLRLGLLVEHEGGIVPTLTGLLTLGTFPQQYFPQLMVTVSVYPTTVRGEQGPQGERFQDSAVCQGSLPQMVEAAVHAVGRNLRTLSTVREAGRTDLPEIRPEIVREAVANALMHRDYSPQARGSQVQIELFPDRMEVRSPGGLFGNVTESDLGVGGASSSRNALLAARLMEVTDPVTRRPVAENRGSGLAMVVTQLLADATTLPQFRSTLDEFTLIVPRQPVTPVDASHLPLPSGATLSVAQQAALTLAIHGGAVDSATFRRQGLPPDQTRRQLRQLETWGLLEPARARGSAQYRASARLLEQVSRHTSPSRDETPPVSPLSRSILAALANHDTLDRAQLQKLTGGSRVLLTSELNTLLDTGLIEATAPPRSPKRRYRLTIAT